MKNSKSNFTLVKFNKKNSSFVFIYKKDFLVYVTTQVHTITLKIEKGTNIKDCASVALDFMKIDGVNDIFIIINGRIVEASDKDDFDSLVKKMKLVMK